ncbi:tetratricopeptide repeat protein [Lysobacter korlensis]|uniref:Tetratricopeptide repeat protein n=1 Tax=Lysobacter korlensis TaxID=553636 RepID=A0ABV6RRY1_9GAMM
MRLSINPSKKRLGLAVAAALAAAVAATIAFDAFEQEQAPEQPQPPTVASDAVRPPAVLDRVFVRPPSALDEAPGSDDAPTEAVVAEALPPDTDALPQPEPRRDTAVVMAPPDPPAAPQGEPERRKQVAPAAAAAAAEPERRKPAAPAAAPREDIARTVDAPPDAGQARRLNREGIELINAGRPEQAIAPLERAAQLQPRDAEILGNLGYAYMLVGEYDAASRHFMRALDLAPNRSATWLNLGQTYAELGDRERAVDAVVTGYRHSTRKASVRSALLAAATGSRHTPQWREAAGLALARIGDG